MNYDTFFQGPQVCIYGGCFHATDQQPESMEEYPQQDTKSWARRHEVNYYLNNIQQQILLWMSEY